MWRWVPSADKTGPVRGERLFVPWEHNTLKFALTVYSTLNLPSVKWEIRNFLRKGHQRNR